MDKRKKTMKKYSFLIALILVMCLSCKKQKEENLYKTSLRESLIPQIGQAYYENDWGRIVLLGDSLIKNGEKFDDVALAYGEGLMETGKAEEAIKFFKGQLEEKNGSTPRQYLYHEIGNAYHILDDEEMAIMYYEKALGVNPNYARPYIQLAQIYVKQGNKTKAKENYLRACYLFDQHYFYKEELEFGRRVLEIDSTCEEALQYMENGYAGLGLK
jgi:tetratricopeptide (TPR) repeat protein